MNASNNSRESILAKIKAAKPAARPLPVIPRFDIPGKPLQNFIAHLKGFDGDYRLFATRTEATAWLRDNVKGTMPDVCIGEATMAVGETGSLLVTTASLGGNPSDALLSTDLYLLIDRRNLVAGLQEAYSLIDLSENRYTTFFSGPSATADIEAVHITGAQGEISLTALMYNCSEADFDDATEIMNRLPLGTPLGQPDAPKLKLRRQTDLTKGEDSI